MELRLSLGDLVTEARELLERLRSTEEGPTVPDVDIHFLRVQLSLLDVELRNIQEVRRLSLLTKTPTAETEDEMSRLDEIIVPPILPPVEPA